MVKVLEGRKDWDAVINSPEANREEKACVLCAYDVLNQLEVEFVKHLIDFPAANASSDPKYAAFVQSLAKLQNLAGLQPAQIQSLFKLSCAACVRLNASPGVFRQLFSLREVRITRKMLDAMIRNRGYFLLKEIFKHPDKLGRRAREELENSGYKKVASDLGLAPRKKKLAVGDFLSLMLRSGVPDGNILEFLQEFDKEADVSVPIVALQFRREKWAQRIVKRHNFFTTDILVAAIVGKCFDFVLFYVHWLQGQVLSAESRALNILIAQIKEDKPNLELYLYILRKLHLSLPYQLVSSVLEYFDQSLKSDANEVEFLRGIANPIKILILIIEFLDAVTFGHSQISIKCGTIRGELIQLIKCIQNEIEDDKHLELVVFDKDLDNRDVLSLILKLNLVELFENDNMEKIPSLIWNSHYVCDGNLVASTSSFVKLLAAPMSRQVDYENVIRGEAAHRKVEKMRAHRYQFEVWKHAIHLRYLMDSAANVVIFVMLFTVVQMIIYDSGSSDSTGDMNNKDTVLAILNKVIAIKDSILELGTVVYFLIFASCQHVFTITFILLSGRRLTSKYAEIFIDLCIIPTSAYFIIKVDIPMRNGYDLTFDPNDYAATLKRLGEFNASITGGGIHYCTPMLLALSMLRALNTLRPHTSIGPFIKTVRSMISSTFNFAIFYIGEVFFFSLIMYVLVNTGNGNTSDTFSDLYRSFLVMFSSSLGMGSFDYVYGDTVAELVYALFLIINMIVVINMIIAMLTKIYDNQSEISSSLYMLEIVGLRNLYEYDENYSALVSSFFPFNYIFCTTTSIAFVIFRGNPAVTKRINAFVLRAEYIATFPFILFAYLACEAVMFLPAYLKIAVQKFMLVCPKRDRFRAGLILKAFGFLLLGGLILLWYLATDVYYFTLHCFNNTEQLTTLGTAWRSHDPTKLTETVKEYHSAIMSLFMYATDPNSSVAVNDILSWLRGYLNIKDALLDLIGNGSAALRGGEPLSGRNSEENYHEPDLDSARDGSSSNRVASVAGSGNSFQAVENTRGAESSEIPPRESAGVNVAAMRIYSDLVRFLQGNAESPDDESENTDDELAVHLPQIAALIESTVMMQAKRFKNAELSDRMLKHHLHSASYSMVTPTNLASSLFKSGAASTEKTTTGTVPIAATQLDYQAAIDLMLFYDAKKMGRAMLMYKARTKTPVKTQKILARVETMFKAWNEKQRRKRREQRAKAKNDTTRTNAEDNKAEVPLLPIKPGNKGSEPEKRRTVESDLNRLAY